MIRKSGENKKVKQRALLVLRKNCLIFHAYKIPYLRKMQT